MKGVDLDRCPLRYPPERDGEGRLRLARKVQLPRSCWIFLSRLPSLSFLPRGRLFFLSLPPSPSVSLSRSRCSLLVLPLRRLWSVLGTSPPRLVDCNPTGYTMLNRVPCSCSRARDS